jgi:hypothetical protein
LRRGNARHRLRHVATNLTPAGTHTDILLRNSGGLTTAQTCVSAAAKILPTTPTRQMLIAARAKGYCTYRAFFTLLRCTTDELLFFCCGSVAAHFKHAAARQPVVPEA